MTGRERVERDMDECILLSKSYADFKNRMVRDFYYRLRKRGIKGAWCISCPYTAGQRKKPFGHIV